MGRSRRQLYPGGTRLTKDNAVVWSDFLDIKDPLFALIKGAWMAKVIGVGLRKQ